MPLASSPSLASTPRPFVHKQPAPSFDGVITSNENHYPGWTARARSLVLSYAEKIGKPFSVNHLNETSEKQSLDLVTKTKSGIGAIFKMLAKDGQLVKLEQLTHDDNGNVLRRDVGLWATPSVAKDYDASTVVYPQRILKIIDILKQCSAAERDLVLNAMAEMESD